MSQPPRVIYLPPGVSAGPSAVPPASGGGIPFDRAFFERVLPPSIAAFCQQLDCDVPVVELTTLDGTRHYVNGISGVADSWVALHTASPEEDHPAQVFIPYQTIYRVEIHPERDARRQHLGFVTTQAPPTPVAASAPPAPAKRRTSKK